MFDGIPGSAMSRRAFLLGGVAFGAALFSPTARAEEADALSGLSVGEYLRRFDPDAYAALSEDMRALLDSSPMFDVSRRAGSLARADIGGSVSLSAYASGNTIPFSFAFSCSRSCDSLYALVTVTNTSSGYQYLSRSFYGSGTYLSGSGTAYGLPSGTYSVVVTAYSPNPPAGYTSSYYQDWRTCYV